MRPKGYTLIEFIAAVVFLVVLLGAAAVIYAIVHFVLKLW